MIEATSPHRIVGAACTVREAVASCAPDVVVVDDREADQECGPPMVKISAASTPAMLLSAIAEAGLRAAPQSRSPHPVK